jgi:RNA polymerase sigma factor (sigma-70 family)
METNPAQPSPQPTPSLGNEFSSLSREELILAFRPQATRVSRAYAFSRPLSFQKHTDEDFVSAGMVGLLVAVDSWDRVCSLENYITAVVCRECAGLMRDSDHLTPYYRNLFNSQVLAAAAGTGVVTVLPCDQISLNSSSNSPKDLTAMNQTLEEFAGRAVAPPTIEETLIKDEMMKAVKEGIAGLPPLQAEVLRRLYFQEETYDQISEAVGFSVKDVIASRDAGIRKLKANKTLQAFAPKGRTQVAVGKRPA